MFPTNFNNLLYKVAVAIEFATMFQASGPGKNAGNGVGAGRPSLRVKLKILLAFELYASFKNHHASKIHFIFKHLRIPFIFNFHHMMAVQFH